MQITPRSAPIPHRSRIFATCLAACMASGLAMPALAGNGDDDILPVPLTPPQPIDALAIAGLWNYTMTQPSVSGRCPAGFPASGQLQITVFGSTDPDAPTASLAPKEWVEEPVQIDILSGAACKPAAMCHLSGTYYDDMLTVATAAVVDDEGGKAQVGWSLQFTSGEIGSGQTSSSYVHPQGLECFWEANLLLTRPDDEESGN